MNPTLASVVAALAAVLLTAWAELRHAQRCASIGRLAFGPAGRPRSWTQAVPTLRVVAMGLSAWGLAALALMEPELLNESLAVESSEAPNEQAKLQRVVLLLDVSPSMNISDSGLNKQQRRRDRVLDVIEGVISRIALSRTRFSVVVFFTSARPIVVDASDVNVIRNVLDNLPLVWSFQPGETRLLEGIRVANELAEPWPDKSATMMICTDGDTVDFSQIPKLPRSIRNVEILAVGDPLVGTLIGNHDSRQDASVLRRLAAELHGSYHNVNTQHLPSTALTELAYTPPPPPQVGWQLKDLARCALAGGVLLLTLIPVALQYLGSSWNSERETPVADNTAVGASA